VDKRDIHAPEAIREFKNRNPATRAHIRKGNTSESPISSLLPSTTPLNKLTSFMSNVNTYYLGSLERIFRVELEEGLITHAEA